MIDKARVSKGQVAGNNLAERSIQEDAYDPFTNRASTFLTSDFAVFMHLVKSAMGTDVLFLPHAFRRTGYASSIVCGIGVGTLCVHTAVIVQCSQELCRRNHVPKLDFAETAQFSFQAGPERIRKYGRLFGVVTNVIICSVHFQAAVDIHLVIEFFSSLEMNLRLYVVIFFPVTCALGFAPNLWYLAPFSVVGALFLFLGVYIALYYFLEDTPDPRRLDALTTVLPVPMYCAIIMFAFHNMTLYLPLTRNACDTVIKNLPMEETLAQVVKVVVFLPVLFTLGLAYYVPISVLWPAIRSRVAAKSVAQQRFYESLLRLCGVMGTTLSAIAVPQMVPLLGLFSALGMSTIMLLILILIETSTKWAEATRTMLAKNIAIFVVWLLILIFGTIESVWSIVREYGGTRQEEC
ncbi:hypothetical protein PUN28_005179 [Cardiocondyla obscurior]|uniref:Amino acid transporter transmembrane domain-containing protein n=1 Tax=Cardiocondyla obscurior TaxID=286306 RepID=A0AAW2GGE0_9HYME